VDPMSDERSWISPYNYCQWKPVRRVDPDGTLDWHPGFDGDLQADPGDNIYTLQNYIWRHSGSTITVSQATKLFNSMDRGRDVTNRTLPKSFIRFRDIKSIAGDHIASMISPGGVSVRKGHEDFMNSEPVKLGFEAILFLAPVGQTYRFFKLLEMATFKESSIIAGEFMFTTMPQYAFLLDRYFGGKNVTYGNLPSEFLKDIGYPNAAEFVNVLVGGASAARNVSSGNVDMPSLIEDVKTTLGPE